MEKQTKNRFEKIEGRLELSINKEKTKLVKVKPSHEELNFLGFTLRYDRDLRGRGWHYLNIVPSKKAQASIREKIRGLTKRNVNLPFPIVIAVM